MAELKLVVFDCDGVMFDSLEANRHYYNNILAAFGHPPMDNEELNYVHIHHVMDSVRHIFRNYPEDHAKADLYRQELDYSPYLKHMRMEPDLPEFLSFLRPKHHTAISTNRSTTMAEVLRIFELDRSFDKVVTALDVENSKPHPEALHKILTHFQVEVAETIYIGDSQVDREHTRAVGMDMVAFKNPALEAEYHVNSFMEITKLGLFDS